MPQYKLPGLLVLPQFLPLANLQMQVPASSDTAATAICNGVTTRSEKGNERLNGLELDGLVALETLGLDDELGDT